MIKCIECGKVIKDGGPRYATLRHTGWFILL